MLGVILGLYGGHIGIMGKNGNYYLGFRVVELQDLRFTAPGLGFRSGVPRLQFLNYFSRSVLLYTTPPPEENAA